MRIALVISSLAGGGAERVVAGMANYWAERQHEVAVVTWEADSSSDAYALDSRVLRLNLGLRGSSAGLVAKMRNNAGRLLRLRRACRDFAPHVVLSFMDTTNVLSIIALLGLKIPVIVSERSDPRSNFVTPAGWRFLRRWTYRFACGVVAQTVGAAEWLRRQCGTEVHVVPNFLRALPPLPAESLRGNLVVAVGRLAVEKDLGTLIRAFAAAQRSISGWDLVLVGDGPLRTELELMASSCRIASKVRFEGFVVHPEQWMSRAGIYVLCSRFEGFPNALLEAMAMGAPVVASDCLSGPGDLIVDRSNGRLFPVGDVDALSKILVELMRDASCRLALGRQAASCREIYELERIMMVWDRLIADCRGRAT